MSATDEKHPSSVSEFTPTASRFTGSGSSISTCADTPITDKNQVEEYLHLSSWTNFPEQALVDRLVNLLGNDCMLLEELGLLYSYRYATSFEDDLKALGHATDSLKQFLENHKSFCINGNQVKTIQTDEHLHSPTAAAAADDDGDDYDDDADDFVSASGDSEAINDQTIIGPCSIDGITATCVYSVLMLLRLRASCCSEKDVGPPPFRYGTCSRSDLPATTTTKVKSQKATRTSSEEASPASMAASWRQALPASAADSWIVQQRKRDSMGSTDDDQNVLRAARSILNKLTVEKFDSLFEQLATCGIQRPHHVAILMREVFEKATTQHHFIPMYAELCSKLEKDPRIAAVVDEADQLHNFRRILLNQCQHVFEQLLDSHASESDINEEILFRRKQQALGNMKLIGHLLVNGMLSSELLTECCQELLGKRLECAEALESLVALVMVAGPKFDDSACQHHHKLARIFSDMHNLTKDKSVAPRLRFLIRDVLDARAAGWPSSRGPDKTPAKLEEVRNPPVVQPKPPAEICSIIEHQGLNKEAHTPTRESSKKKTVTFRPIIVEEGIPEPEAVAPPKEVFDIVTFRRALASVFTDLASDKNIPAAVQRIRSQEVPLAKQAEQFVDMLTRTVEERRGAVRRCQLAFIAGLAAAECSAFDRNECLSGIQLFFKDVYPELCNEVHRLPAIMKSEFMPTVLTVFPSSELNKVVPAAMRK